jgi:hypothetical protein
MGCSISYKSYESYVLFCIFDIFVVFMIEKQGLKWLNQSTGRKKHQYLIQKCSFYEIGRRIRRICRKWKAIGPKV